jgi:hypothetical protein
MAASQWTMQRDAFLSELPSSSSVLLGAVLEWGRPAKLVMPAGLERERPKKLSSACRDHGWRSSAFCL